MTPDQADAMFGWRPGTVARWQQVGILPPGPVTEYAAVVAFLEKPAVSAADRDRDVADWAARVREALSRREAGCQTTADPSAPTAA